jgi:hypothetical protein
MNSYLSPCAVRRDGGHILDAANPHSCTGKGTECALSTGSWGLGSSSASSTELDVEGVDANFLAAGSDILGSQHSGIGRGLVTISLDFHSTYLESAASLQCATARQTSNTGDGFLARGIGDVHEGVVEARENVRDTPDELSLGDLGSQRDCGFFLGGLSLLRRLKTGVKNRVSKVHPSSEPPSKPSRCVSFSETRHGDG